MKKTVLCGSFTNQNSSEIFATNQAKGSVAVELNKYLQKITMEQVRIVTARSSVVDIICPIGWDRVNSALRTEVRGNFNIYGTKYFKDAVFHQKSKIYDVVSLLYHWLAKEPVLYMKYWQGCLLLKMPENDFSRITSRVNLSFRERVVLANQRYRRLTTS